MKRVSGGLLIQDNDQGIIEMGDLTVATKRPPTEKEMDDLLFAWKVVKYVKSNAIVYARDRQTIGIGAGQMSRVDSVEIALKKAGEKAKGAVMASDAFFPFKDSIERCVDFGITAIIQPGGSKRDQESIECCDKHNIAMIFTGSRHFKH